MMDERESIETSIACFLRIEDPSVYCDACLAFTLRLDVDTVRLVSMSVATRSEDFERREAVCEGCERVAVVTAVR